MQEQNIYGQLRSLDQRVKKLQTWLKLVAMGWLLTVSAFFLTASSTSRQQHTFGSDSIKVRKLVIIDENNKERIVIAAPIPDPIANGEVRPRRSVVDAGIQFKDPNGNERGGIASMADGSFAVGIDDETGRERAHLFYVPGIGSGVYVQGKTGAETISLVIPSEGGSPKLELVDRSGKKAAVIPDK